jgi:hypothetical protein
MYQFSLEGKSTAAEKFPEILHKVSGGGKYTNKQLYNCDETAPY